MDVNITKEKKQTNVRSSTSDNFEKLIPPKSSPSSRACSSPPGRALRGHARHRPHPQGGARPG